MKSKHLAGAYIALSKKYPGPKASAMFFNFIEKKGLMHFLPHILSQLDREAVAEKNRQTVVIRSRHKLSPAALAKIKKLAGAKENMVEDRGIDETLIGGFVVEYNNMIYDASVKSQLEKLRVFLKNTIS